MPPSNRPWKFKLCPTVGPGASPPLTRAPHRAFEDTWSQTWAVGWLFPWLFLHFCMQLVCGVVAALEEAGSLFMFWMTPSYCEEKYAFVLFFPPTSFQTHTHNFCQTSCTLSPPFHVFAMSQKLIISSATACNLCPGGKQEATGKPEDFHEAWNKPLQTAYTTHRSDLKLTSREKNALQSVRGKTAYP